MAQFAQALRRLLDPEQDSLLPGYADLVKLDACTTASAVEDQREEAQAFYEAKFARFSKDRRAGLNRDYTMCNYLLAKKANIAELIRSNMKKIKKFPKKQLKRLSAEEKVEALRESLRNPQLKILAEVVRNHKVGRSPQNMSTLTQRPQQETNCILNNASARSADLNFVIQNQSATPDDKSLSQIEEARGIKLSDLGTLLQDLEAIELEAIISEQEKKKQDLQDEQDEELISQVSIEENRQQLTSIQQRPRLSELLYKSIAKNDAEAARQAEQKLEQMIQHSEANLGGRVKALIGIGSNDKSLKDRLPPDNRYKLFGIKDVLMAANKQYNFSKDIDDSDEEEISDDELRNSIKKRKWKEIDRRDDLKIAKYAALGAIKSVQEVRNQISVTSLVDKTINLDSLKARQARIRESINEQIPQTGQHSDKVFAQLGSPTPMKINKLDQSGLSKIMQPRYDEPLTEEKDEESSSSQDQFGPKIHKARTKRDKDLVHQIENQMRKLQTNEEKDRLDSLDQERVKQFSFKASFIGHISSIQDKRNEYKRRLKTMDNRKSTKTNTINQAFYERQIYENVTKKLSRSELEYIDEASARASSILKDMQAINNGSMSSLPHLSNSKMPTLREMRETVSLLETRQMGYVSPGTSRDHTSQSALEIATTPKNVENIAAFNQRQPIHIGQTSKNNRVSDQEIAQNPQHSDLQRAVAMATSIDQMIPFRRQTDTQFQSNMNNGGVGSSTSNQMQQLAGYSPYEMDYPPPLNNHFSSLSLKIVHSPRQQVSNNARHYIQDQKLLIQSQSHRQEQHHIFKKAVMKDEHQSNITLLKSQKELPKVDSNAVISKLQQSASDIILKEELNEASRKNLKHERSGFMKTNSKSLMNTASSASHERLFQHKLAGFSSPNADLQKENILPMPEASPKKSMRKNKSGEIADFSDHIIANSSNEKLKDQSTIQLKQEAYQKDINELPGNKISKNSIDSSLVANMKQSNRGSPYFLISPKQDGIQHEQDTQLGTTNRGTSSVAIKEFKQQLQQTNFEIPLPKNLRDNARMNQRVQEHQLAQKFRTKMQRRFGATTNVFSPKKGAIEKLRGSSRHDPNNSYLSMATEEVPGLEKHRFSVAPSEAKSKKSNVILSEKPILAHEFSVDSCTTNTNLRNSIIHEARPLYLMIDLSDQQQQFNQTTPEHNKHRSSVGVSQHDFDQLPLECHPEFNNVIKLELQERPRAIKSPPKKRGHKVQGVRDSLEAEIEIEPPSQHICNEQGTDTNAMTPQIGDFVILDDVKLQEGQQARMLRDQGTDSMTPYIIARVQVEKKSSASVVTQTMRQSNQNLTDQSQNYLLQLSTSPLEFAHSGQPESNKNMKGSKVPSNFQIAKKLDEPIMPLLRDGRKQNISILNQTVSSQQNGANASDEQQTSKSGSNLCIDVSVAQNSREASPSQSHSMLTPHLQGTNVRIALQKEKSKILQFLHETGSKQSLESVRISNKNNSLLHNKGSSPFLTQKQQNFGIETELQVQAQDGKEIRKKMPNSKVKIKNLSQSLVKFSEQAVQADDFKDISDQQYPQSIRRNSSQPENLLLQCDEEDDAIEASSQHQFSHGDLHIQLPQSQSNENKRRKELQSGTDNEGIDHSILTAKGWTPQHPSQARQHQRMINRDSGLGKRSNLSNEEQDELAMSEGDYGDSQVRIEQDIKEMQSLLPPLLETASTKQFFKESEIRMDDGDRKRAEKRIKDGSVPLMYVRDSSKMSVERRDDTSMLKLKVKTLQKLNKNAQLVSPRLNHSLNLEAHTSPEADQRQTYYLGMQHHFSPSHAHDNQRSEAGAQSLLRESAEGSSVYLTHLPEGNHLPKAAQTNIYQGYQNINSRTLGPYLKTFTQQVKLPNLNRSVYNTQHTTGTCSHQHATSPTVGQQQQQFSSKHLLLEENGQEIVGQRMANNFLVQIKRPLNQSVDGRHKLRSLVLDGTPPVFDLGLDGRRIGIKKEVGRIKLEVHSDVLSPGSNIRGKDGRIYMHQTLTQVLMSPQDLKPRQQIAHKTMRAGSQTSKNLPKPVVQTSMVTIERKSTISSQCEQDQVHTKPSTRKLVNKATSGIVSGQTSTRKLVNKATSGIVSGSMELSLALKRQLANQISSKLVPLHLPPVGQLKNTNNLSQDLAVLKQEYPEQLLEASMVAQPDQDASSGVIIGLIRTTDQVRDLINNPRGGSVMISRPSMQKVEEGSTHEAVQEKSENQNNRHNSAAVSNSKKSRIINQVPQTSNDTLLINKQGEHITSKHNDPFSPKHANATQAVQVATLLKRALTDGESRQLSPHKTTAQWSINPRTSMREEEDLQLESQKVDLISAPRHSTHKSLASAKDFESEQVEMQKQSVHLLKTSTMTMSSEQEGELSAVAAAATRPQTKEELLFLGHEQTMARLRDKEKEQALNDSYLNKQPISFSGQNDISESIWIDQGRYSRKHRPNLVMKDLQDKTRNGKVEMGQSPFNLSDFIRMDGQTARMTGHGDQPAFGVLRAKKTRLPKVKVATSLDTGSIVGIKRMFDLQCHRLLDGSDQDI